jgi:glutaredoxin 3
LPVLLAALALAAAGCGEGASSLASSAAGAVLRLAASALGLDESGAEPSPGPSGATPDDAAAPREPTDADAPEADEDAAPPAFYRYLEADGSLRYVQSLDEVPPSARAGAEPVRRAASPARRARAPALANARPRPWAGSATEPAERRAQPEVVVYTTSWCPWCRRTLAWLDAKGVDYVNKDIEANDAWRDELVEKTGRSSIPVVEVDGQLVQGFDQSALERLL